MVAVAAGDAVGISVPSAALALTAMGKRFISRAYAMPHARCSASAPCQAHMALAAPDGKMTAGDVLKVVHEQQVDGTRPDKDLSASYDRHEPRPPFRRRAP